MSTEAWTISRVATWVAKDLSARGFDTPRFESELLVSHALKLRRIDLYLRYDQPLTEPELVRIRKALERRRTREPIAYITGSRDFYGRTFKVDARVLVPRPETEEVVAAVLERLPPRVEGGCLRVLDLCAGSGVIGVTLALERSDLRVDEVEISEAAAEVCRENIAALGVSERVKVYVGSLYKPVLGESYAVVVSNPPYIATEEVERLMPDVSEHEPRIALDGGPMGDTVLGPLVMGARAMLEASGWLVVEIGYDQGARARELAERAGLVDIEVLKDLGKLDRVLIARNGTDRELS